MEKSCKTCKFWVPDINNPYLYHCSKSEICDHFDLWKPTQDERVKTYKKPPLGVMPERIWKLIRCQELSRAIHEYLHCDEIKKDLLKKWAHELVNLIDEMEVEKNDG